MLQNLDSDLAEDKLMYAKRIGLLLFTAAVTMTILTACQSVHKPPPKPAPKPTPTPQPQPTLPPSATMSLREYLKKQLGADFHPRADWAGTGPDYAPRPYGERVWASIGNVYAVTIHHAQMRPWQDTAAMIRAIYCDHTNPDGRLDAADVGYHFLIDHDGKVWEGRDAGHVGTHVGSHPPGKNNPGNLGICVLDSFLWQEPASMIVERTVALATLIARYYGRPLLVRGHRDWGGINGEPDDPTECPGRMECAVSLASIQIKAAFAPGTAQAAQAQTAAKPELKGQNQSQPRLVSAERK